MKRLAVFFCVLLLFGCGAEGEASFVSSSEASLSNALVLAKHEESHELTTMKLTLEKTQYSLQDEGVTGTLTNHGTTEFLYWEPRDFVLEVKQGERWYSIPQHNRVLADEGHFPILPGEGASSERILWSYYDYDFPPGRYRVVFDNETRWTIADGSGGLTAAEFDLVE